MAQVLSGGHPSARAAEGHGAPVSGSDLIAVLSQLRARSNLETRNPNFTCSKGGAQPARYLSALVPDLEEAVPGPRGHGHAVVGHTQAADTVVMPSQDTWGKHRAVTPRLRALLGPGGARAGVRPARQGNGWTLEGEDARVPVARFPTMPRLARTGHQGEGEILLRGNSDEASQQFCPRERPLLLKYLGCAYSSQIKQKCPEEQLCPTEPAAGLTPK